MCFLCFLPMSDRAPVPAPRARPRPCGAASGPGQASGGRERGPRDPAPRGRGAACAGRRGAPHEKTASEIRPRPREAASRRAAGAEAGERAHGARGMLLAVRGGPWRLEVALQPTGRGWSPGPTAQCPFSLAGFLPSPSLPFFLSPSLPSFFSPSLGLPHRPHLLSSFFLSFFHPSSFPDSSLLSHCSLLPSSLY